MTAPKNRDRILDVREERSSTSPLEFRKDADSGQYILEGYAATYEPYDCYGGPDMGGWVEQLSQRSFETTLKADPDVQLLLNHGGAPLARTKSGTMRLTTDRRGLRVWATLDPSDPDVQALAPKMMRGDMDEMSFSFRVKNQEWDSNYTNRSITEVSLQKGDVSVVNYGMNPNTSVSLTKGTIGALSSLSNDQLLELRKLDSNVIERAIDNLRRATKNTEEPMQSDMNDDPDEDRAPHPDGCDCEFCQQQKEADDGNDSEPDGDPDDDMKESKSIDGILASALASTIAKCIEMNGDDNTELSQLLARAKGQLNQLRGNREPAGEVSRRLSEIRKDRGLSDCVSVTEGTEWLRQQGTVPLGNIGWAKFAGEIH